jgi:guanine nucleotide-binding protein subunit beta-2-like 1 protein
MHNDWVSCVKFFTDEQGKAQPMVVSASYDKTIKVWNNNTMQLMHTFVGHKNMITCIDIAPSAAYMASGSKDCSAILWNLIEGKYLGKIDADAPINALCFCSKKYWLIIGTDKGIQVWDLPNREFIANLTVEPIAANLKTMKKNIACLCLGWNESNTTLFAGFADGYIRVFKIIKSD